MNKTSIECEQCFKIYKQVDSEDITCERDLRAGLCKDCIHDNIIIMIMHAHSSSDRLLLCSKRWGQPANRHLKEYISICDQVPFPQDIQA